MYADASHGNLPDGGSQLGHSIFLVGEHKKCSILNWQSKRIKHVFGSFWLEKYYLSQMQLMMEYTYLS